MKTYNTFLILCLVIIAAIVLIVCGCQESQKLPTQAVWGNGDPDPAHQQFFGNSNLSRLCFVQTNTINKQGQFIAELALRVSKLEDPNNGI